MTVTADRLKRAAEQLRDEMTDEAGGAMIWPMAMDILASSPHMLARLTRKLNEPDT